MTESQRTDPAVRSATPDDAVGIRELFVAAYDDSYTYASFYDLETLRKLIYDDDTLVLVVEEPASGRILGTASVVYESGAYTDLVGEFGRLVVHPDARSLGLAGLLLAQRVARARKRIQVGYMEARIVHTFSVQNAVRHDFAPVGFLASSLRFGEQRESAGFMVRYFGGGLELRRNHPRIVPEAYALAELAMENVGLLPDVIVDEAAAPYPHGEGYSIQELTEQGYSTLLRIERGRLRRREIFGPLRLHYGFHKLRAEHSAYLLAERDGRIAAAVGYTIDAEERTVRVFELIWAEEAAVRFVLSSLVDRARRSHGAACILIDVSAHAPRMQRTLVELGFVPVAYVPALAFHRVERLDLIRMERLFVPAEAPADGLPDAVERVAATVLRGFERRDVLPRIAEVVDRVELFAGLTEEQTRRLAGLCGHDFFEDGEAVFVEGDECDGIQVILKGQIAVEADGRGEPLGTVGPGETLGEVAALTGAHHSASARARGEVEVGVLDTAALGELVRRRPDIGVVLYRNLARGLGAKLRRAGRPIPAG